MCVPLVDRDTGDVKIPVFAPRQGGAKMAPKHATGPTVQGGSENHPPNRPPPGGWRVSK